MKFFRFDSGEIEIIAAEEKEEAIKYYSAYLEIPVKEVIKEYDITEVNGDTYKMWFSTSISILLNILENHKSEIFEVRYDKINSEDCEIKIPLSLVNKIDLQHPFAPKAKHVDPYIICTTVY